MIKNIVNGIVILDAIPEGEMQTAKRLKEDLLDLSYTLDKTLEIRYIRIETFKDLENGISGIFNEIKTNGLIPWFHLEGHGLNDETGFRLACGEICSWSQLKELITPLNICTDLNIILILATCYGGSFTGVIRTSDRAPVSALIGPKHEIQAGEVEKGFIALYKTFFKTLSLKKALVALQKTAPEGLYYITTAERFFYEVWYSYKKILCTKEEINRRVKKIRKEAKSRNHNIIPSIGFLKRLLKKKEPELFEQYRNTYFMYDLNNSNRERYPVTYKEAEKRAKR